MSRQSIVLWTACGFLGVANLFISGDIRAARRDRPLPSLHLEISIYSAARPIDRSRTTFRLQPRLAAAPSGRVAESGCRIPPRPAPPRRRFPLPDPVVASWSSFVSSPHKLEPQQLSSRNNNWCSYISTCRFGVPGT
ncbi:hypothetical protein B0H17DRAFT_5662 [Mycena rosella]|uniref:Uncharacterized protein n=1 Tax=Mycena rosella TaxID=1033263 RepID=A0AAD7H0T9_MYCRO|nr:hypothetical protein B0H17DRAFT_233191 [Mycena rosella]KAJ7710842.1 hypothetical protein B0H17DRAFT_5662 [Mycena rosella]